MYIGLSETIALLTSCNSLHYQIWMVYVVVALGLLGFRFSETYDNLSRKRRYMMIIGFIAFSVSNLISLEQNIQHFNTTLYVLKTFNYDLNTLNFRHLFDQFSYKDTLSILGFQIGSTCVLCYLLYKPREQKTENQG